MLSVLKKLVSFRGRTGRLNYLAFLMVITIVIMIVDLLTLGIVTVKLILLGVLSLLAMIPISVRRLHDTGRSGWWLLIFLVPFLGQLILLVFMFLDSEPVENKYGPCPPSQIIFSFEGRINRAKFWGYSLLLNIIWLVGLMIDSSTTGEPGAFCWIGILISFCPALALNVKRCHDRDKSGWFYLVSFIPFLSIWYLIEIGFLKGTDGDNRFGPDPLGAT